MKQLLRSFGALLTGVAVLSAATLVRAEHIYIAQTSTGTGAGTTAGNAKAVSFFNNAANWSSPTKTSGKIGPGDTVHLVGTLTTAIEVKASGTAGNVITILFEPNAKLSSPAWSGGNSLDTGAISVPQLNYIVIDGGQNGLIENTANGTRLANQNDSTGVNATSASHFTVKNLTIRNMYVRESGSEALAYGAAVVNTCKNGAAITDFTVDNCTISDAFVGINTDYAAGCANYTISNNTVFNCNWGGRCGDRNSSSVMTGMTISNNRFYNWKNWDGTAAAAQGALHHNGFYCWAESGGTFNSISVYGNYIGPNYSGVNPNGATAGLFISGGGIRGPILIYNNLFVENSNDSPSNGNIFVWPGKTAVTRIYNNTFSGGGSGIAVGFLAANGANGSQTLDIQNNIFTRKTAISVNSNAGVIVTSANNSFSNLKAGEEFSTSANSSSNFKSLSQWAALGFDPGIADVSPALDENFLPQPGASLSVIGKGMNLSAYFNTDKNGRPRSSTGSWDIGAYTSGTSSASLPPSNAVIKISLD